MNNKSKELKALINILLDKEASIAERDDVAMDLGEYDEVDAINTLIQVAQNPNENEIVLASCGESIAMIWLRKGQFDIETFSKLSGQAKMEAKELLEKKRPDWLTR